MAEGPDVVVVGGGVIGLASAWRLAQRGLAVTLVDRSLGAGASHVAAGMLAPVTEVHYGEERQLALALAAANAYPDFAAEVEDASGTSVAYRTSGALAVAVDGDDKAVLDELATFQRRLGLDAATLTAQECRQLEPLLAPGIRGGVHATGDHQVDSRRLVTALVIAGERAGVVVRRTSVTELVRQADRVVGVRLDDGTSIDAATTVVAAGCWSSYLVDVPVRPVKGQIVRLHDNSGQFLGRTVRAVVHGASVYVVPRADGEVVVGATMEEQGYDTTVTAGAVYELLRDARTALPGITELPLLETIAGLRPGSPDNIPIVGPGPLDGVVVATGHGRNGILLTPVTADAVADLVTTDRPPPLFEGIGPERFTRVSA